MPNGASNCACCNTFTL
ncbi:hypothetical protein DMB84_018195 [Pectobacterium aquaticum]|uniref:Uncharacterized protein n=2 Tax=Pectobacterium TaxID=122277 RepID=A0AA93AJ21_9GAMM|nr:hypothetical protein EIP93_02885 [Pectobacterium versatile]QHP82567.1 hypothetical protein EO763_05005 [Pectobacterium odoriferum]RJL34785.1 hypothetical protein D5081_19945 [Pectobacterium carotovorum]RRN95093.1 hypothetical protein DMB79_014355 [Pectobacterium aquaticum]TKY82195.1 hypothetical protein EDI29_12395 [Pectobacterium polonicum]